MARTEPMIFVECDKCGDSWEFGLTPLAGGGWDDRNMSRALEKEGWLVSEENEFCEECRNELPDGVVKG